MPSRSVLPLVRKNFEGGSFSPNGGSEGGGRANDMLSAHALDMTR